MRGLEIGFVVSVLAVAAVLKAATRDVDVAVESTALGYLRRLFPSALIWYGIVGVETGLALAVGLSGGSRIPATAAAAFFVAGSVYSLLALRLEPDVGCGCLGVGQTVTWRAPVRAALPAFVSADLAVGSTGLLGIMPWFAIPVFAVLFVVLSPELRFAALVDQARRFRHPRSIASRHTLDWALDRLYGSASWAKFAGYVVSSTPSDHWREGCWRFVSFDAIYSGEPATSVFGIRVAAWGEGRARRARLG